jgi:predicted nucleic acid-binding protein
MIPLVLDGSVTMSFLLRDEYSPSAMRFLAAIQEASAESVFVPVHFWIEVTNGLMMAERRHRASQAETTEALQIAFSLPVTTDGETIERCPGDSISLAREHGLTLYDAAYLELAIRRHAKLATVDKALARAARSVGIQVIA